MLSLVGYWHCALSKGNLFITLWQYHMNTALYVVKVVIINYTVSMAYQEMCPDEFFFFIFFFYTSGGCTAKVIGRQVVLMIETWQPVETHVLWLSAAAK